MDDQSSNPNRNRGVKPKVVRSAPAEALDAADRQLLALLSREARMSNVQLAEEVGLAPSTVHGRVRRLVDIGVIRGFYADIDPAAVGRPLRAMIAVSLQSSARGKIREFVQRVIILPEVLDAYFLAGADDYMLHVAASGTEALRQFVENLNARDEVAGTQTSLVFEHLRGAAR